MDQKRYDLGLAKRRQVLGDAYVDRALPMSTISIAIFSASSPNIAGARPGATKP